MRKSVVLLFLCLGMLCAATALPVTADRSESRASAADLPSLPAVQADSLVDAYGIGIHLAFLDTPYADATKVAEKLDELGVRHVRDDLFMNNPRQYAGVRTVADKGIKFNMIMGNPSSPNSAEAYVDTVATQLPTGAVESVEGSNEWDLFSRGALNWPLQLATRQRELYQAAKANSATAELPVLAPALAFKWNYVTAGDLSQNADYANGHMYPGGYRPSNEISQITAAIRGSIASKPLVTTESGYHNAMNTTNGHRPVPEDAAGVYLPRLLLEHYLRGEKRLYSYELIDEFNDPGLTNPEAHFGLLRRDWSPKPAFTAMKNTLALLDDPGPSFTPAALPVRVAGFPGDGKYVVTQKRNGQYVVLLWRDVSVYDPVLQQPQSVAPTNVTMELAKTSSVKVYRPSSGAAPVTETQASSIPLKMDGSVTAVTIDPAPAPAPHSVTASAGDRAVTVAWDIPATGSDVSGFSVTRQPGGQTFTVPATARSYRDTGLANGQSYTHSVRTLSPDGSSAAVAAAPAVPATVPSTPRITATTPGKGSITVTWTKPSTQGRPITGFELRSGTTVRSVGPTVLKATLSGLPKGKRLRVGVRARNAVGWGKAGLSRYVTTRR